MKPIHISHIYIDPDVKDEELTATILERLPSTPKTILNDKENVLPELNLPKAKSVIHITSFKGSFCKPCPGTSEDYICCNYYVINETTGCPLDCTYCILQDYLDTGILTVYTNYKNIFSEVDLLLEKCPNRILRIGTGELADSLALEPYTDLSKKLIPFFEKKSNLLFELKTKTNFLPNFDEYPLLKNLVLSWSLNPELIIKKHELKSARFSERILAAKTAQEKNLKLSFHFDPVIYTKDWQEIYGSLIDSLFKDIDPSNIAWISIGGLRFPPELKSYIREKRPHTDFIRGEQILGKDKKLRYFKPLRSGMFKFIYNAIRSYSSDVFIYFCMEDKKIWFQTMGYAPENSSHLDYMFAKSLYERFPDMNFIEPDYDYYQGLDIK